MTSEDDHHSENIKKNGHKFVSVQSYLRNIPIRLVFVSMCFFGCFVMYSTRVNMSMALVCMVNHTALVQMQSNAQNRIISNYTTSYSSSSCTVENSTAHISTYKEDGPFIWEEKLQGIILCAFFWGNVMTYFPAGILADKFGAKWILGICLLLNSVLTILLPFGAHHGSVHYIILFRFLCGLSQGVLFPSLYSMMAKWFPQNEKNFLTTASTVGCGIGVIVTHPVSAYFCTFGGGWERIFYLFGGLGVVWFVLWTLLTTNKPSDHPWISVQEKDYIESNIRCNRDLQNVRTPWKKLLTTPAFLSLCFFYFVGGIKNVLFETQFPTYLKVAMGFSLEENGFINVLPIAMAVMIALCSSAASDRLKNSKKFRLTTVCKSFAFVSSFISCSTLIAATLVGCNRMLVVALLLISMSIYSLNAGGIELNTLEMAPNFAGTIAGFTHLCLAAAGIFTPYAVGVLAQTENSATFWPIAFYLSVGTDLFGLLVYLVFGSAETQPWNEFADATNSHEVNELYKPKLNI